VWSGGEGEGVEYSLRGLSTFSAPPVFSLEVVEPPLFSLEVAEPPLFSLEVVDDILMMLRLLLIVLEGLGWIGSGGWRDSGTGAY